MIEKQQLPKATHTGIVDINGIDIECYNLDNGERVLSRIGFLKALGRTGKAKGGRKYDNEFQTAIFLSASNLKPLLTDDLIENSNPIIFYDLNNNECIGYKAEILPQVAFLYNEAYDKGLLKSNQIHIGIQSKILVKALLSVSMISLVDEATGYQYEREKGELQAILKVLISDEILEWQQAFHLSFYREIFRLWGIPFTEKNIKRKPQFLGHLTNKFIYQNLPQGTFILEKLKEKTPRTKGGSYKYRLHQSLTPEAGREALKKVIYSVEALASISETKRQFIRHLNDKYGQRELPFVDLEELDNIKEVNDKPTIPKSTFDKQLKGLLSVPPPPKKDKK